MVEGIKSIIQLSCLLMTPQQRPWTESKLEILLLPLVGLKCSGVAGTALSSVITRSGRSGKLTFRSSLSWPWIV